MKRLFKGVFLIIIAAIVLVCGLYVYGRYIEPGRLAVRRAQVETDKLSHDVVLALVADTHIGRGGMGVARLQGILDTVAAQSPDAVVFLGDLFDNYSQYTAGDEDALAAVLALPALADVPKYAVYGNHDLGGRGKNAFRTVLEQAGWQILVNQRVELLGINLMGSDDMIFGQPAVEPLIDPHGFNLLLVHEPDIASTLTGIDLQLSGHTHGGQVRLPLLGAMVLPQHGREYVRGMYSKADGGKVYVSTGLGMSTLPFRFAVTPEIVVITVRGTAP